jgi:universal stress protein E
MKQWASPKRILVAVSAVVGDDERLCIPPAGRNAVAQAAYLAKTAGAELRVVHVVDFVDRREPSESSTVEQRVAEELGPQLAELAASAHEGGSFGFLYGMPWEEITKETARWSADLLVITPRRALRLGERLLFGRTAGRLIRYARCPVWVIHPHARRAEAGPGVDKVLGLVDRSQVSDHVVAATDAIAALTGAERHLLTCLDYPRDIALHQLPYAQRALAKYHRQERSAAEMYLAEATRDRPGTWIHHLGEDWVVRHAPKLVTELGIDLVVIAAVSKRRLAGMLLGTTAEKLIGELTVSCLVVRADD